MRIAVIGTGYVGLVTGACFAETGNDVNCIDIDEKKIANLRNGILPIYEPGLGEIVSHNLEAGRLTFTTDLEKGLQGVAIVFIGVGTPQREDGSANLDALWSVADAIRTRAKECKMVVVKSTVPVGTNARLARRLNEGNSIQHKLASNPEFLKEGFALDDFQKPDRVVVGARDPEVIEVLRELHAPLLRTDRPFVVMTPESAEMTKYAANLMLATKISFINEMANLCERLGADINEVRKGIGYDQRIGFQFLHPGVGYGGSCFPKDVRAMVSLAKQTGIELRIMTAVDEVNNAQKEVLLHKLFDILGTDLHGKTIAIWGLAFKARTDDIREAPALVIIEKLLAAGAELCVHDPRAMSHVRQIYGDRLSYSNRVYGTLEGADALLIVTDWQEFRNPNFDVMRGLLRAPIIIDGRNLYETKQMEKLGFVYSSIGRATVGKRAK